MTRPRSTVEAGQVYRIPRPGKPAHHVRVARVNFKDPQQPKIHYTPITRTGGRKPTGIRSKGKEVALVTRLTWREGSWCAPPGWELEEGESS